MYGFVVTTAGEGLLARAAAGDTLTITAVRVGSGAVGSASAAKALTALIQDRAAGTYSTPQVSGGQLSLVAEYRNNLNGGLQTGFTLREFGVFARAGDDAPTLMYYAALGDRAPQVPPITEGLDVHRYPVAVAVSGELSVTVEDPAGAFVTDGELANYVPLSQKGQAGGVASLGSDGKVPEAQLPEMDYLPLSGGTMQGNLNMGAHRLTGLPAPQADSDAARKSDVDEVSGLVEALIGSDGIIALTVQDNTGRTLGGVTLEALIQGESATVVADASGRATIRIPNGGSCQVRVPEGYADLSGSNSYTVGQGQIAEQTLTLAYIDYVEISESKSVKFSAACTRVDVCCVGGGGGGSSYRDSTDQRGGGGGHVETATEIEFDPDTNYAVIIGAGGAGAQSFGSAATNGGSTSFGSFCTAQGGTRGSSGGTGNGRGGLTPAGTGGAGTESGFSSFSATRAYGGGGGGGGSEGIYSGASGGSPYGGRGGNAGSSCDGQAGTGYGGGGGAGGGKVADDGSGESSYYGDGGAGYQGVVCLRMHHTSPGGG